MAKILICGLPGSGKTTLANKLSLALNCVHLNADEIRKEINKDLGFSMEDRIEQARRMGKFCDIIARQNDFVIADFICPTEKTREAFGADYTIWMNTIEKSRFPDTDKIFEMPSRFNQVILSFEYNEKDVCDIIDEINLLTDYQI